MTRTALEEARGDARIRSLVLRIRREMKRRVPHVHTDGPAAHARVLIVLRDPGDSEGGALRTGYVCPTLNGDATALNEQRLMARAGLPHGWCVFWNAVPWDLQGRAPTAADMEQGARYLSALVERLPRLRAVVACGNEAHAACAQAGITSINVCHPGNRGLNGGVRGARAAREADFVRKLRRAKRLAMAPKARPSR